ncbi:hypothetical protein ABFS82_03G094200 [Erythranthe guttata]|uniref:methyl-CpG-binding domain-containing protein 9 isoform X1 n=2 Tax=Erythranthe guttata TaxID=4155 RepID=UPI00064DEB00|nr:PREDICTED: methyl-CpG-binding domain-containing protein 9 isoform X1 [Erythranthe guttata]|eukprot:XP_012843269.1 PREDICTED: methyl-CpG-binding domain-containing protein 9 isoform X1 [Erythranthe guttata]
MVDERRENDFIGVGSRTRSGMVEFKVSESQANGSGSGSDAETGSSGLGGGMLTYKRRRIAKDVEHDMVLDDADTRLFEKSMKSSSDQVIQESSHTSASHDCVLNHQRNIVLERICQSLETEGGLKECIQNALALHPRSGSRNTVKESVHYCKSRSKYTSPTGSVPDSLQNEVKGTTGIPSSQSASESNHDRVAKLCRCTLFDVIMSEQFAQLCSLFLANGMKADKLFDLSHVNSRMKEKAYESSPTLFHSDLQQIWTNLQRLGNDIISLVKCLSDKTMTSFCEQVGSSENGIFEEGTHELLTQEYSMHKTEPTQACAVDQVHTCRHCREKIDGRNGLVCDSCEEMYHLSCIEPPIEGIPVRSWYCANCTGKGIESPHDNCIACERLNASNLEDELIYEAPPKELEESSTGLNANEGDNNNKRFPHCKSCRMEVKNEEDYRICGHSFCEDKFYHVKCLTTKQLISYGPCWYCPSCLCRACFVDRDDDKIVLCDGCDHAYHLYCMDPPRETIPIGKWFCTKCDVGIQRVLKAKQIYENMQNTKSRKRSLVGETKTVEGLTKSGGGMDMLLNAAKTLNYEENLVANGLKA